MTDSVPLRQKAEFALTLLEQSSPQRPIFVEFSGTPKSGKSTCIDIVAHFFRRLGFRVLAPSEGASRRTPYHLRTDLVAFNTWSASYALTHILESLHDPYEYHLVILDRGLFDALAWFQLLLDRGEITPETCDQVHNFLRIEKWRSVIDAVFLFTVDGATSLEWRSVIDAVFLFTVDGATSLERENQYTLIDEPGRAMNPEFLQDLNNAYGSVRKKYASEFQHFENIDTSNSQDTTPQSTASKVADLILDRFNRGQT